ncbi:substrate-binding domain-containing protein [Paenibacillus lautus]|uniref:substrate-binding domain-containing protein n=1 Tax=Paenibacillus lautus TaxID=1401 RepID=UPI002DB94D5A|nr:substrate-binding domain-containing protein [Paenibacillus lautus]MEC0310966.1 substrate-binding domain-containing protein [Paenibacillus lautus]
MRCKFMAPGYHFSCFRREPIEPFASDLAGHTILVKEPTCVYRELWETAICGSGQNLFSCMEVGSFIVIQQMVKAELGIGIVPIYSALEQEGSLVIRPIADLNPVITIGIAYKDKNFLGKAALWLMEAIRGIREPNTLQNSTGPEGKKTGT